MNCPHTFYSQLKPTGGEWATPKRLLVKPTREDACEYVQQLYRTYCKSPEGRVIECPHDLEVYVADKDRELKIYAIPLNQEATE